MMPTINVCNPPAEHATNNDLGDLRVAAIAPSRSTHIESRIGYLNEVCKHATSVYAPAKSLSPITSVSNTLSFIKTLRQVNADVFHAHYAIAESTLLTFVAGKSPLLVTTMGADILYAEQGNPTKFIAAAGKTLLRSCDAVTVKTHHNAAHVRGFGVSADNIHKIVWGVDARQYFPLDVSRETLLAELPQALSNQLRGKKIILQPRGTSAVYNNDLILAGFSKLKSKLNTNVVLWLPKALGQPESAKLQRQIESLDLQNHVILSPALEPAMMNAALNLADVTVSVAKSDGLPMTILESLSAGTPVVAAKLPHFERELGALSIQWCNFKSDDLCDALEKVLCIDKHHERSQALSRQCHEHFNLDSDLAKYQDILLTIAKNKRNRLFLSRIKVLTLLILDKVTRRIARMTGRKRLQWLYTRQQH